MIPAIISLIILLSGGGAAAASQTSLPGDILYPVKNLTEDVRLAVTLDQKAKADLNIGFAQTRIEEIQKLLAASSTEQNANQTQAIQKALDNFSSHLDKALSNADNLKKENKLNDALDITSSLKDSTDAYTKILSSEELKTNRKELKDKINATIASADSNASSTDATTKEIKDTEDKGINQNSAEGKIKAAENKIAEVEKFLNLKNETASSITIPTSTLESSTTSTITLTASSTTMLDAAKAKLQEAKNYLAAGDYKNAFQAARESMDLANSAKHHDRLKKLNLQADYKNESSSDTNTTSTRNTTGTSSDKYKGGDGGENKNLNSIYNGKGGDNKTYPDKNRNN